MGLADRHYMREPEFRSRSSWSVTAKLMLVITAAFVAQMIVPVQSGFVEEYLTLSKEGLAKGCVWQLLTFQFLHAGPLHLIFNLLAIWFFGRPMEEAIGAKGMLKLYFTSGMAGGLLQITAGLILPAYFGGSVVGASAGGFGLIAAFAAMFPDRLLTLLVFFVVPVSMRARTLLWISLGVAALGPFVLKDNVAHAAHLGGILAGWAVIRWRAMERMSFHWPIPRPRRVRTLARVVSGRSARAARSMPEAEDLPPEEFISREVDPILDKISQHGIQSLTERERRILEKARERMARR